MTYFVKCQFEGKIQAIKSTLYNIIIIRNAKSEVLAGVPFVSADSLIIFILFAPYKVIC